MDIILIVSSSITKFNNVFKELKKIFDLTDNGDADWHLGCRISRVRSRRTLMIDQEQYPVNDTPFRHCVGPYIEGSKTPTNPQV